MSISEEEAVEREERGLDDHARLPVKTVYQIVRQEGQEQMERPAVSLWWSGFAGGLSISFSLLGQALSCAPPRRVLAPARRELQKARRNPAHQHFERAVAKRMHADVQRRLAAQVMNEM